MAITKIKQLKNFEVDGVTKTVSVSYEIVMTDDVTGEQAKTKYRRAFTQGQIEDVKTWAGVGNSNPYIVFLNAIWS